MTPSEPIRCANCGAFETNRVGACMRCGRVRRDPSPFDDTPLPDTPLADFSHVTWITITGDEVDELAPWHVQTVPGMISFRGGRRWIVEHVRYVVPTKQMPPKPGAVVICFVVCREQIE